MNIHFHLDNIYLNIFHICFLLLNMCYNILLMNNLCILFHLDNIRHYILQYRLHLLHHNSYNVYSLNILYILFHLNNILLNMLNIRHLLDYMFYNSSCYMVNIHFHLDNYYLMSLKDVNIEGSSIYLHENDFVYGYDLVYG